MTCSSSLAHSRLLRFCIFAYVNELRSAVKCVVVCMCACGWECRYCNALTWCGCIHTVTKTGKEGTKKCLLPCTPLAIIKVLEYLKVSLSPLSLPLSLSFLSLSSSLSLTLARSRSRSLSLSRALSLSCVCVCV